MRFCWEGLVNEQRRDKWRGRGPVFESRRKRVLTRRYLNVLESRRSPRGGGRTPVTKKCEQNGFTLQLFFGTPAAPDAGPSHRVAHAPCRRPSPHRPLGYVRVSGFGEVFC